MALSFLRRPFDPGRDTEGIPFEEPGAPGVEEIPPLGEGGQEQQDFADLVEGLLAGLQRAPVPEAPKIGKTRMILGGIGDALQAFGRGQLGAAQGEAPFAAAMRSRASEFEARRAAAEEENRRQENAVRIEAFKEQLMRGRPKPEKTFRPQLKTFNTVDKETGRPVDVPYLFDPNTMTLSPIQGGEINFYKFVRPFLAQGVNTETGELEFKLVDPLLGMRQLGAAPGAPAALGAPPPTPDVRTVPGIEPKPPTGEVEAAEAATVIQDQLANFGRLSSEYVTNTQKKFLATGRAMGQGVVRAIPGGQVLTEVAGDPAFEELTALRDRIGQQLARLVENGRLSDQDREFALRNLPNVPALTTVAGRKTAAAKIALVQREITTRLARKQRLRPGLMGGAAPAPEAPALTVDEILKRYQEEFGANPTP